MATSFSTGWATPHTLKMVLEGHLPLCPSDQVIRESGTFHDVVGFVVLPGYRQLDVALELATPPAHCALELTTPIACPASVEMCVCVYVCVYVCVCMCV